MVLAPFFKINGSSQSPFFKSCKRKGLKGSPSTCSRSTAEGSDVSIDKTADYGVILVKSIKEEPSKLSLRPVNDHRGYRAKKSDKPAEVIEEANDEETFLGFLSAAFCGACVATSGGDEKALATAGVLEDDDNDIVDKTNPEDRPRMATNIYIQRFQKMKQLEIERCRKNEASLLTDVSFLTDPLLTDIEVDDRILRNSVPTKPKVVLPAFRKLHGRAARAISKRKQLRGGKKEAVSKGNANAQLSVVSPGASSMPPPPPPPLPREGWACDANVHSGHRREPTRPMANARSTTTARRTTRRGGSDNKKTTKKKGRSSFLRPG
mmetsp:Transcript_3472/g.9198  ORF Transcript_3472/g.9198 Transcript_3472/m.9198 type:complete len:322 (+) Transcript_3472:91-1056(+)